MGFPVIFPLNQSIWVKHFEAYDVHGISMNFWLVELSAMSVIDVTGHEGSQTSPTLGGSCEQPEELDPLHWRCVPTRLETFLQEKQKLKKLTEKKWSDTGTWWYMIKPDWLNHRMMRSHYQLLVGHLFVKCWDGWGWMPCPRMYMSQEKHLTHNDFEEIKEKVDWVEIHGAAAVTRKTMWFVKEGCRRAMAGRAEVGKKSLRVLGGTQSRMPRDCIRAWMSNRDAIGYHRVVECCWCLLYMASLLSFSIYFAHVQHCACT